VLSSIRAPRMGTRDRQPEPWAVEGKEFLRWVLGAVLLRYSVLLVPPAALAHRWESCWKAHTSPSSPGGLLPCLLECSSSPASHCACLRVYLCAGSG
jgi:hypothetical protein